MCGSGNHEGEMAMSSVTLMKCLWCVFASCPHDSRFFWSRIQVPKGGGFPSRTHEESIKPRPPGGPHARESTGREGWHYGGGDLSSQNEFGKVIHFLSHQSLLDIDGFLSGNFGGLAYLAVTWG